MSECNFNHNHDVSEEIFKTQYVKNRITPQLKDADLTELVQLEPENKKFKIVLQDKYKVFLTNKDSANLKAKFVSNDKNIMEKISSIANKFVEGEGNIMEFGVNLENELQFIYIQLQRAVRFFEQANPILLVDGTYRVNNLKIPLYVFMTPDRAGYGRVIAVAFIASETSAIISKVFSAFKKNNPCALNIQTVIVDKSMTKIASINENCLMQKIFL